MCGCHRSEFKRTLAVDHNRKTGKVRGLLCINCNVKLGVLEDEDFKKMANRYLAKFDSMAPTLRIAAAV